MGVVAKDVIHVSDKGAASDFASLLARVRRGAKSSLSATRDPWQWCVQGRYFVDAFFSESIAVAEAHAKELGYEPTMDPDFAADLREIINSREPRDLSAWE
jgi:hypothetical protein